MQNELLFNFFPPGGDVVAGVTEVLMWALALMSLLGAIMCGLIRLASRRTSPRQPAPVPLEPKLHRRPPRAD